LNTRQLPEELAFDLARRSPHPEYRMAAVLIDHRGRIFAWGWNHPSTRKLQKFHSNHCEYHAISRASRHRLPGATIVVVALRKNNNVVTAKPCENCLALILKHQIAKVVYSIPGGFKTFNPKSCYK